ncbi:unnamed protein product [Peronospora belbahrii]|uniref:protein-tyrosine-phosphatase n=1 Tax=Peronospora belbahrii TaxID=622444 RepID=A0AAU9KTZ6_9STRA|nr:unnamed protein product [Peronospora belbahrii]
MIASWSARLGDAVCKLVLLPVVGLSLCGCMTIVLGLQWMETLQRQHQIFKWRARMWAALLTLVPTLLPFKRLEVSMVSAEKSSCLDQVEKERRRESSDSDHKKDVDNGEDNSRSVKRQKTVTQENVKERQSSDEKKDQEQVGEEEDEKEDNEDTTEEKRKTKGLMKLRVRRRVFIWDLDETLVLFASLYTGAFAQTHGKEVAPGVVLGEQMMTFMLTMLERHFFFSDLHDTDVDHIAHVTSTTTDEKLSVQERYERIREIYERRGHVDFLHDANSEWFAIHNALISAIDNFSTGWLNEARQVLELIAESAAGSVKSKACPDNARNEEEGVENVNVLVTNTQLVPALCKCLIYQLDSFFPIDHVYSSAKVHKYHCFETILKKYDAPDVEFVAIGDGLEEEHVSLALGLQFHKIRSLVDLRRLRYDLQLVEVHNSCTPHSATAIDSLLVPAVPMSVASSPIDQTTVV